MREPTWSSGSAQDGGTAGETTSSTSRDTTLRLTPALLLAAVAVLLLAQVVRLVLPGRGPYLMVLGLSAAGVAGGELLARLGGVGGPALGALHPGPDLVATALLQAAGALLVAGSADRRV